MKYKCNFGAGSDTIFYNFSKNEFYSYEMDLEGPEVDNFYLSKSGYTGEGYFYTNDCIKMGYVRIDCNGEQRPEIIYSCDDVKLFSYVTIKSHEGIQNQLIVADGENILFLDINNSEEEKSSKKLYSADYDIFKKALKNWKQFWNDQKNQYDEYEDEYINNVYEFEEDIFNNELEKIKLNFNVLKFQNFKGWNLKRFISIPEDCRIREENHNDEFRYVVSLLKDHHIEYINKHFVVTSFRNTIIFKSEYLVECLNFQGFSENEDKDIFYKLKDRNNKKVLYGFKISEGLKKYENNNQWFEYEAEVNYFEGLKELKKQLNAGIRKKMKMDFVLNKSKQLKTNDIYIYLKLAKFKKANIKMSVLAGNCEFGTRKFLETNKIDIENNEIKINDLIKDKKKLIKMCEDDYFKKSIAFLMMKKNALNEG